MRKVLLLCGVLAMIGAYNVFGQGATTSSIAGRVLDTNGEALPGANLQVVQTNTNTQYGNSTDAEGYFRIANMLPGGPYTITVSFVGYENYVEDNVFLTVGQTYQLKATLNESAQQLQQVTVTAKNDVFDGNRTGQQTIVDRQTIAEVPTLGRSIQTFWQINPFANIQPQGDNNTSLTASIAGMNNRYNALYIDGAVNNDVFGLAGNGSNGGQTGVAPISMDAIDQFQISVAPFDIRESGFAGGSVNAVTRSGSNDVSGSAYYFVRNQNMAGKTPTDDPNATRKKLADFTSKLYGFRLGGALVKDKAFFFINGEIQNQETPQPFDPSTYIGASSQTDISNLVSALKNSPFSYDPGDYTNNANTLKSQKFLARFDFNLSPINKLTIRHSYVHAENISALSSSTQAIRFYNTAILFPSTTNSTALELKSNFAHSSNHLTLGSTLVRDDRNPYGSPFPALTIYDGTGTIYAGSEQYSTANQLNQNILTLTDNFELYRGKQTITIGTNNEYYYAYNLFIRQAFGSYTYGSLADFMNKAAPLNYARSYSLVDDVIGDGSKAAAEFHGMQLGAYAQDEIQFSDRFKATFGFRLDLPIFSEATPVNSDFNSNSVPLVEGDGYKLHGARTGKFLKSTPLFSPRIGFNYDVNGDNTTQLRGGIGIFTSRIPLVWPGGAYNNTGTTVGGVYYASAVPSIWDYPTWNNQPPTTIVAGAPSGEIDLFAHNFRLPQVLKFDLALDRRLPGGVIGTVEGLYTKYMNNLFYTNANVRQSDVNRSYYSGPYAAIPHFSGGTNSPAYTYIMLATNTSKGYAYNFALSLSKQWNQGMQALVSYSYGDSFTVNDLTSSQNNSQWRYRPTLTGQNDDMRVMRSGFSMGGKILAQLSYRKEYAGFMASQLSLLYSGQSGTPYSYLYSDGGKLTNVNSVSENLVYIPKTQAEASLVDATVTDANGPHVITADQQWAALDKFISDDKYLSKHRGEFAERNSNRTPFRSILDFRFLQDFFVDMPNGKRNTLEFSLDIFNLGNLLNKDWGRMYYISNGEYQLETYKGVDATTNMPTFTFTNAFDRSGAELKDYKPWTNSILDNNLRSSRWQMEIGLRYIFN